MLKQFNEKTYQFAGSVFTPLQRRRVKKNLIETGKLQVRTVKDARGYTIWIRPIWMDVKGRSKKDYRLKFGSDDLLDLGRSAFGSWVFQ